MSRAVQQARASLKGPYERLRRSAEPLRRRVQGTLTRPQLAQALTEAGVARGATVMVHTSMDAVMRATPGLNALALIELLQELLGDSGTLLVPTFPFSGFEADYLAGAPCFDVRRTPSRMGLMTELFRRLPETTRSIHPTHPVSGWGAHAAELLATHHEGETFDERSPFCRMRERQGVVVGLGVGLKDAFTIIHAAEYLHPQARAHAFSPEAHSMTLTDGDAKIEYTFHALRPRLPKHLRKTQLSSVGALRYRRRAGLLLATAQADAFIERVRELISLGSFYGSGPLARR